MLGTLLLEAVELLENMRYFLIRNTCAVVRYPQFDGISRKDGVYSNPFLYAVVIFDGVVKQVEQHRDEKKLIEFNMKGKRYRLQHHGRVLDG